MAEMEIGVVTHYFGHINVAAIVVTSGEVAVGDTVRIKGRTSDVTTMVESMQLDHKPVDKAGRGGNIGIRVPAHVREHDKVYKVLP
jgi:translation elongation factor EF-Tu-like GTPase